MQELVKNPHVVIIGAGFGGLRAARTLRNKPVEVTLIDRNNYHLFQPLLYQVATSTISSNEIAYPVRSSLRGMPNVHFQLGAVERVDLDDHCIYTDRGPVRYDHLVLAVGGETNYFGMDSVQKHGIGLKDLEDATRIRNHLLGQFEQAVKEPDPQKRRRMLTFVIVGGGPTGVECAGAVSELIRLVLTKDYPRLNISDVRVILLEAIDRVLANMPEELSKATARALERKHVELRFGATVADYDGSTIHLKSGESIETNTLIWAAGVRASRLLDGLGLEQDKAGRVKVEQTLQVPGHPEIFVIGDAAHCLDEDGKPLPMIAPVAMQQASVVAKNILRKIEGKPMETFTYKDPGVMATIGRNQAVAHVWGLKLRGYIAWLMWLGVHILQLIGFRNRLAVLIDWAWAYIFYERANRIIGPS